MEVSEISEKSRSLDLQSLYGEKPRVSGEKSRTENGREEIRALKRKRRSSSPAKKRRKGRKEVSLRTFATVVSDSKKGSNAVGHSGSNSVPLKLSGFVLYGKNRAKKKNGSVLGDGNLKNSSSLNNVSHGLGDSVIVIPKRPRGFFGQKKFQNDHVGKQAVSSQEIRATSLGTASSHKTSSEVQRSNLNGDSIAPVPSSTGKRKKIADEFKENNSIRANSDLWVNGEDGSGNLAPKVRRNRRKRQKPAVEMQAHDIELPVVANVVKVFEDMKEDDEENLEQNAARMLSSRFDPSCTGFSRNSTDSKLQSADGSLYPSFFHREFKSSGTSALAESESASVDAAGRVLRPRKQHRHRGLFRRRRRHFYEMCSTDLDAYWVVNQRIKVFWPLDKSWYFGVVKDYDTVTKLHHVKYDDRDEEWINLQNERFKLLLLPGEVPCKFNSNKSRMTGKQVDESEDVNGLHDSCTGNFMDSEPIISWLARSTHRVKSSPLGMGKKQKRSHAGKNVLHPTLLDSSAKTPNRCLAVPLSRKDTDELSIGSVMMARSVDGEIADKSIVNSSACANDRKLPLVYFRRRFRKGQPGLGNTSEESSVAGSVTLLASVADSVGALEEFDIVLQSSRMKGSKHSDQESLLLFGETFSLSKLPVSPMELEVKLRLSLPLLRVLNLVFGAENFWLHNTLLLLRYGTVMIAWPKVHLEVLFIDNTVGLRYLLFEGCLLQAVAFMCFIMGVFQQPNDRGKHGNQQVPVTSIRFQLSGLQGLGRQLVFVFYSFLELRSSKWLYLDNKLRRYCIVTKELPLAECTYGNIMILQSGIDQTPNTSVIEEPVFFKGSQKRTRQGIKHRDYSSCKYDEKRGRLPPFVLSFAAAPTFFLSLHLNLLMKNNVASISFQNRNPMSLRGHPEKYDAVTGGACSLVDNSANQVSETLDHMEHSLSQDAAASSRWLSCAHSKVEMDALSMNRDGDWIKTSQNNALSVTGTAVGFQDSQKNESFETVSQLDQCPCHAGSCGYAGISWSSAPEDLSAQDKSETRCLSCLNSTNVQTPELGQTDCQPFDKGALSTQLCVADLAWSMNDCTIRSPNPTAPRSIWHRNRRSSFSSSFSYHSKTWPDGRADFVRNGCVNGSRKPRTQVSYLLPFGGYNFGSKPRSHHRKGRPYKRIKNDGVKRISDGLRSPQIYPEMLSCDANVLVTAGDRGWRECGAQVVLESPDHKDWRLLVKISGMTRYSHKAHQFLQPGTTNRYTHAMMWKGGKDWILEFSDRSQWSLFKGLHEECYNRNLRAASVKNIPIPGVRLIEDSDDNAVEVPFVRSSPKYFRLVETEVDLAMDPSRVLYDMESDDEEWISKLRNSDGNGTQLQEISEEMFERAMDVFEKVSYAHQCDDFSNDEIECFMDGVGPVDVIKAIHEHWRQKRKRKGMPLIRQLQPPLWERYQQQLKDWELAMSRTHYYSNGCKEKAVLAEKPPMFAFCLRPRGLEVPNKGTKQRSHRKFTAIGQYGAFSRDQDGQVFGRKLNGFAAMGDEKALVAVQSHESLEVSPRLQLSSRSSPRDAAVPGILSMSSDRSERNQYPKLQRNKSKKMGVHLAPTDPQMVLTSYNQRSMVKKNGVNRWNMGMPEWPTLRQFQPDGFHRQRVDQLGGSEFDEFRLRDASSAAQHASNMAKLKREKAQRLMHKADVALHKAVAALTIAEAMRATEEDLIGDG
ncbi:uncharacterized protein LOC131254847 [Magnolia sinica]|uniref:uncharacterized protein LOC131254847 n=1 Tax=Magnolia sinica TaxID=86752 RepID=UPI00265A3261|nr:uncharacterized protein LOC131254847 [Magnolia sinica]